MSTRKLVLVGLVVCALVAIAAALFASGAPDGLTKAAQSTGLDRAQQPTVESPLAGYSIPGVNGPMGTALAGLAGAGIVLGCTWALSRGVRKKPEEPAQPEQVEPAQGEP